MKEISIFYLFNLIKKNLLIIVLCTVVIGTAVFSYCTFLAPPKYSATTSIIISNGTIIKLDDTTSGGKDLNSDISASNALAENCVALLQTPKMYKLVAKEVGIENYTVLRNSFYIKKRGDVMILDITATALSPEDAVKLSKCFANICPDYLSEILSNVLVSVIAEAEGAIKISPQTTKSTFIGAVLGMFLSFLLFLVLDIFDQTVHTEDELSEHFSFPVLGVIPDFLTAPAGGYNNGDE